MRFPDFAGNRHFNTFGNLELDDRAGLLFIDFAAGDALYLTGRATVTWDAMEFEGSERTVAFILDEAVFAPAALPIAFSDGAPSPFLEDTGAW